MADPRDRPTAQRPLRRRGETGGVRTGSKRALVNVGGAVETSGDATLARALAGALGVRAGERDATLTHPFHAYPARLHPAVARALVEASGAARGGVVLDPFCGSGTVLIEALAAGRHAVGRDLSPLAVELARIKTRITSRAEREAMVSAAYRVARAAGEAVRSGEYFAIPRGESLWFAPALLAEVSALAAILSHEKGTAHAALRMLLSSILVKVSLQASDSDPRRIPDKDVPAGTALRFFGYKSRELSTCLAALAEAVPQGVPWGIPRADIAVDDATELSTVPDGSVDAVVTSPPYANTYDYVLQHTRRYAWLGIDSSRLAAREVGAARWFDVPEAGVRRFEREITGFVASVARALRPGGLCLVVIADGAAGGMALRSDEALARAASTVGMTVVARASQSRTAYDPASARVFAQGAKREHVVAIRRPVSGSHPRIVLG